MIPDIRTEGRLETICVELCKESNEVDSVLMKAAFLIFMLTLVLLIIFNNGLQVYFTGSIGLVNIG